MFKKRWLLPLALFAVGCTSAGTLKFAAEVPHPPAQLPVLKLAGQPAPVEVINRLLAGAGSAAKLAPLGEAPFLRENQLKVPAEVLGVVEGEHVKAWTDLRTGEAAIYPTLDRLRAFPPADAGALAARASEILESSELIARDDTRFVIDQPRLLNGATLVRDTSGVTRVEKQPASYLAYLSARRLVAGLPVDGPGSRALLAIGDGGSVEGLTRAWKTARESEMVSSSRSAEQVRKEIARQLRRALKRSDAVVDSIELAYYDGNRDYLQPVYRFTAHVRQQVADGKPRTDDNFVIGYVPYAQLFESLPVLGVSQGVAPSQPTRHPARQPREGPSPYANDPLVGRYVVRNDDSGWVADANAFWNSISSTWTAPLFTNSQYYWAEPRLFTGQKDSFINAMNLALIEAHGNWWLYSTLSKSEVVNVNGDIPSPGYGPSANGRLADWIIHSCEVVPAPDDTANWPDPWWRIFGGVRNVVGYRTIMYISDGAGGPYGTSLGNLAPVVSSWLGDVMRPMGRPSTISMCGHDGDSVLSTSVLGRADCLTVWWFPD